MNIILDDLRDEQMCYNCTLNDIYLTNKWLIIRTYNEFINYITNNGLPDLISFDHDLADFTNIDNSEYTGKDACNWLIDYCIDDDLKLPDYLVHSSNTVGNLNIKSLLDNFKKFQK